MNIFVFVRKRISAKLFKPLILRLANKFTSSRIFLQVYYILRKIYIIIYQLIVLLQDPLEYYIHNLFLKFRILISRLDIKSLLFFGNERFKDRNFYFHYIYDSFNFRLNYCKSLDLWNSYLRINKFYIKLLYFF